MYVNNREIPAETPVRLSNCDRIEISRQHIVLIVDLDPSRPERPAQAGEAITCKEEPAALHAAAPGAKADDRAVPKDVSSQAKPAARFPAAQLVPVKDVPPGAPAQAVRIEASPSTIGRSTFKLDFSSGVSREHAEIGFDPERQAFFIRDLNSTNRVSLAGNLIPPGEWVCLTDGAEIGLGSQFAVRFEILDLPQVKRPVPQQRITP